MKSRGAGLEVTLSPASGPEVSVPPPTLPASVSWSYHRRYMRGSVGPLVGQGRSAEVFEWSSSQVLKLFRSGFERSAEREFEAAKAARTLGAKTPFVHEFVRLEGRVGILFDRVSSRSLMSALSARPWKLAAAARRMAAAHAAIHEFRAPSLPRLLGRLEQLIVDANGLTKAQRERALHLLAQLPDGDILCHGDFHPGNLLDDGNTLTVVDWATGGRGHPLVDVAVTAVMMEFAQLPVGTSWHLRQLARFVRQRITVDYLHAYGLTESDRQRLISWRFVLAAARLGRGVEAERSALLEVLASYR